MILYVSLEHIIIEHAHEKTSLCVHSYTACKDDNFTQFWKGNAGARMLYFYCMRHNFTNKDLLGCDGASVLLYFTFFCIFFF